MLFMLNLMVMGGGLRWRASASFSARARAEALVWSLAAGLAPFAAVYYPVAIMPHWLQPFVLALPAAHVFEGLRAAIGHGIIRWDHLAWAAGLNVVWMAASSLLFWQQFQAARRNGALMNIGE